MTRVRLYHPKFKVNSAGGKNRPIEVNAGRQQAAWEAQGWRPLPQPSKKSKTKEKS